MKLTLAIGTIVLLTLMHIDTVSRLERIEKTVTQIKAETGYTAGMFSLPEDHN